MNLDVSISRPNTEGKWTAADFAAIFGRQVVDTLIAGESTPERIGMKARLAASYGLKALKERQIADDARRERVRRVLMAYCDPLPKYDGMNAWEIAGKVIEAADGTSQDPALLDAFGGRR